jgi:hypothetical protein
MARDGLSFSNIFFERCRRQDGNRARICGYLWFSSFRKFRGFVLQNLSRENKNRIFSTTKFTKRVLFCDLCDFVVNSLVDVAQGAELTPGILINRFALRIQIREARP